MNDSNRTRECQGCAPACHCGCQATPGKSNAPAAICACGENCRCNPCRCAREA